MHGLRFLFASNSNLQGSTQLLAMHTHGLLHNADAPCKLHSRTGWGAHGGAAALLAGTQLLSPLHLALQRLVQRLSLRHIPLRPLRLLRPMSWVKHQPHTETLCRLGSIQAFDQA